MFNFKFNNCRKQQHCWQGCNKNCLPNCWQHNCFGHEEENSWKNKNRCCGRGEYEYNGGHNGKQFNTYEDECRNKKPFEGRNVNYGRGQDWENESWEPQLNKYQTGNSNHHNSREKDFFNNEQGRWMQCCCSFPRPIWLQEEE